MLTVIVTPRVRAIFTWTELVTSHSFKLEADIHGNSNWVKKMRVLN